MPPADHRPTFPPSGAPISVLVDYDGTISRIDIGDLLLDRHALDREALARLDAAYDAGTVGSRELMRWDMDVLPDPPDALRAEAERVAQDEGFAALVRVVRAAGGVVEVVSDGLGFYIEGNLRRLGLYDVPVATNANALRGGGAGMSFPYGHPACFVCGTCKRERVRLHQAAGRVVVFVGDGPSDRYAMHHADLAFATGRLLAWCQANDYPAIAWRELTEVADWVASGLGDGRLPLRADDVAVWRTKRKARTTAEAGGPPSRSRPPFICGPEAWGVGRTVPPVVPGGAVPPPGPVRSGHAPAQGEAV